MVSAKHEGDAIARPRMVRATTATVVILDLLAVSFGMNFRSLIVASSLI